jgi:hypothetical protein
LRDVGHSNNLRAFELAKIRREYQMILQPKDYSKLRGCADEANWDRFVEANGGVRLTLEIPNPTFPNADYLFHAEKVIVELKVIETEFGKSAKFERVYEEFCFNFIRFGEKGIPTLASYRRILKIIHRPIAATAKKANLQIRETKKNLQLDGWSGLLICINDNFRRATPKMVQGVLAKALNGSMSSIDGAVYLTNHFVEFPGNPHACLVWSPMYSKECDPRLPDFVNWLGRQWHHYSESVLGKFEYHIESDDLTLKDVLPVQSPYRANFETLKR